MIITSHGTHDLQDARFRAGDSECLMKVGLDQTIEKCIGLFKNKTFGNSILVECLIPILCSRWEWDSIWTPPPTELSSAVRFPLRLLSKMTHQ
ncbi:hypothetical protein GDO81_007715 [Engystomops pustulosus]|uniref:Uncharacterized protein n=1 Tax=Engystomops pustulosus TaxID=76066 RepID=A0AAV7CB72_ENGPU|nr:hypothetical protein GDO81_007715 [Engystomops pustulosus]